MPSGLDWSAREFHDDLFNIEERYGIKLQIKDLDGKVVSSSPDQEPGVDKRDIYIHVYLFRYIFYICKIYIILLNIY